MSLTSPSASGEICATEKIFTDYVSTHRAKEAFREEGGSEEMSSAKSEEGEYAYSFDSDPLNENLEGKSNKAKEDWIHEVISEELEDEASKNVMGNSHPLMFTQLVDKTWKAKREEMIKKFEGLCIVIRNVLGCKVEKVIVFDRVVNYSCCLVIGKCGWTVKKRVEISSRDPIKEELRKRVDYMAELRELRNNCRKFEGLTKGEKEDSGGVSLRVINEHYGIDGKYVHRVVRPAASVLTELVMVPLASKVRKLSDIGFLVSIWFPKPRVKMKLGRMRHKKLGSMIPCGQGILRGRDCCDHKFSIIEAEVERNKPRQHESYESSKQTEMRDKES